MTSLQKNIISMVIPFALWVFDANSQIVVSSTFPSTQEINEEEKIVYFNSGKKESYDIIISSLPLPQAQKIFKTKINHDSIFSPCIAMGMTLKGTPIYEHNAYKNINKDVAFLGSSRFYNDQKKETWVLQFTPKASLQMINQRKMLLPK